ncbi:hypothetical protein EE612_030098, partial [Oryza sativa]
FNVSREAGVMLPKGTIEAIDKSVAMRSRECRGGFLSWLQMSGSMGPRSQKVKSLGGTGIKNLHSQKHRCSLKMIYRAFFHKNSPWTK